MSLVFILTWFFTVFIQCFFYTNLFFAFLYILSGSLSVPLVKKYIIKCVDTMKHPMNMYLIVT